MPDITMCLNGRCPKKMECYRFTAIPYEHFQSYAAFELEHGECDFFIRDWRNDERARNAILQWPEGKNQDES